VIAPEINQRTKTGARWSDEGIERVTRLLVKVQINRLRLAC